jgi:polyhydroxybutyrate depolymerase
MACVNSNGAAPTGTLSRHTIGVDGRERSYLLYTPEAVRGNRDLKALVLVFHGGGGTARGIAREVGSSLHSLADRDVFFVAYPDAVDKTWDFGAGEISNALEVRTDDRAFFAAIMDELTATQAIDGQRIFATGISRGGQASYFVACAFPERIRAIAPVAMPMPKFMTDLCPDARGIGVAIINGTEDPLVPYDGGQIRVGRRERGEVLSTDTTIVFWRSRNQCAEEPTSQTVIDPVSDRMQVQLARWDDCELAPVLLYRIEGGGHTWPSGSQYLPRFLVGPVNRDIDGAIEVWAFFSRFH